MDAAPDAPASTVLNFYGAEGAIEVAIPEYAWPAFQKAIAHGFGGRAEIRIPADDHGPEPTVVYDL